MITERKDINQDNMSDISTRGICDKLEIDDVEPIAVMIPDVLTDKEEPINDAISDYEYIRRQSIKNIATCDAILTHALSTMNCEPSPRYVESCATLIDTSMKCSKSLIEIHEKLKKLRLKNETYDNDERSTTEKIACNVSDVVNEIRKSMES